MRIAVTFHLFNYDYLSTKSNGKSYVVCGLAAIDVPAANLFQFHEFLLLSKFPCTCAYHKAWHWDYKSSSESCFPLGLKSPNSIMKILACLYVYVLKILQVTSDLRNTLSMLTCLHALTFRCSENTRLNSPRRDHQLGTECVPSTIMSLQRCQ